MNRASKRSTPTKGGDLKLNPFIQQLVDQNRYHYYQEKYTIDSQDKTEDNEALCGCGCGRKAAVVDAKHSCGCCQHKMIGVCIDVESYLSGSNGLCFHCFHTQRVLSTSSESIRVNSASKCRTPTKGGSAFNGSDES